MSENPPPAVRPRSSVRKWIVHAETIVAEGGPAADQPLIKVAAALVVTNPYAGHWSEKLDQLIEPSAQWATDHAALCQAQLGGQGESFGKAAIVGTAGEQEHGVACLTTPFGDALREATGGTTWVPSNTKVDTVGAVIDIPLAYKRALFVREFYDTVSLRVPGSPRPDEIVVALAMANRGRIHHRVGGLAKADATAGDGLR